MGRAKRVDQCFPLSRSKKGSKQKRKVVWCGLAPIAEIQRAGWSPCFFSSFFSFPTQISPTPHPTHKRVFAWFVLFALSSCFVLFFIFFYFLVRSVLSLSNPLLNSVRIIHSTYPHAHFPNTHTHHLLIALNIPTRIAHTHTHTHISSPCI